MTDIDTLKKAAITGDTKAQNRLGDCYAFGRGVPLDYDEALKWFRRAAEQGDEVAKINVRYAENMKAVPAEKAREEEQFKELEKAAAKGKAEAQFQLGRAYDLGHKIPDKNDRESAKWTAEKWYQKAAKQGHIEAQYSLGYFYANDFNLKDYKKSAKWYRVAAEQGHLEAQFQLGFYYCNKAHTNCFLRQIGFFAKSDKIEALKWYRKAADQGHVQAQFNLGDCYERGSDDSPPSSGQSARERLSQRSSEEVEAVKWYSKAAEHGHANAQYRLGCRYRDGKGVPKNLVEAYKWLNLAWGKFQEKSRRGQELWWDEKSAGEDRDKLAALMTPDQIDEGQRLAREFKPM